MPNTAISHINNRNVNNSNGSLSAKAHKQLAGSTLLCSICTVLKIATLAKPFARSLLKAEQVDNLDNGPIYKLLLPAFLVMVLSYHIPTKQFIVNKAVGKWELR